MGIPRKHSRRITVDGKEYRYLIKETHVLEHKDQRELSITIQELAEKPGNIVQFRADYGVSIHKPDIALNIKSALARGWEPSKRGGGVSEQWQWANVDHRQLVK